MSAFIQPMPDIFHGALFRTQPIPGWTRPVGPCTSRRQCRLPLFVYSHFFCIEFWCKHLFFSRRSRRARTSQGPPLRPFFSLFLSNSLSQMPVLVVVRCQSFCCRLQTRAHPDAAATKRGPAASRADAQGEPHREQHFSSSSSLKGVKNKVAHKKPVASAFRFYFFLSESCFATICVPLGKECAGGLVSMLGATLPRPGRSNEKKKVTGWLPTGTVPFTCAE